MTADRLRRQMRTAQWCAGPKPAEYIGTPFFNEDEPWTKVVSDYDRKTILWCNGPY